MLSQTHLHRLLGAGQPHSISLAPPSSSNVGHRGSKRGSCQPRRQVLQASIQRGTNGAPCRPEFCHSWSERRERCAANSHNGAEASTSTSDIHLSKEMMAAMALSPIAALSLQVTQNPAWREAATTFSHKLRTRLQDLLGKESFQKAVQQADDNLTFMDWTYKVFGVDLSYVWDPELWVQFKQSIWNGDPSYFYNKLFERIDYRSLIPQAGLVGDMRISYAKFLQLLEADRIKRIVVYGDMKTAVVEVPHPWTASVAGLHGEYPFLEDNLGHPVNLAVPNPQAPNDPTQWYAPEMPEWNMEKYRFYLDLPAGFWESGVLVNYLREREVKVYWDPESHEYVLPYQHFSKVFKVRTEVQLLDPSACWDFLTWLTSPGKAEFYEKAAVVCLFVRAITISINIITGTPIWELWSKRVSKKKKDKQSSMWERLTSSRAREFMSRDPKTGKLKDTGVRFSDIAGMDYLVTEMREIVKLLLNDPQYAKVGAKCPRGVIFQGPPGTGKTYLARAIAGEAGLTFFSAVGSEFVEMFAGVAAARVNNLFYNARKRAPCIVFIDEIDAIGRARSTLGADPGSQERESALLAMLVQMDGIHGKTEQVLTIGATNLVTELDQALLRPGRFEVVYELPAPNPLARLQILNYHAKNKQLEGEAMLSKVAEVTQGWSAAALANLMNEAAIMTVRRNVPKISLPIVMELVENISMGDRAPRIPPSEAKDRLAVVTAAKAVALALTPGLEPIQSVTLWSRQRGLGPSVDFAPAYKSLEPGVHPEQVELDDWRTDCKVNAAVIGSEPLGEFMHVAGMLIPLYAPRAAELTFFGKDQCSLATAAPIADCFDMAYYLVRRSGRHPRFARLPPLHTYMHLGEDRQRAVQPDPISVGLAEELGYHKLTLTLLKAAWRRALALVQQRSVAILQVAEELLAAEEEAITGSRLVEIIESAPVDKQADAAVRRESDFMPLLQEVLGRVPGIVLEGAQAEEVNLPLAGRGASGGSSFHIAGGAGAAGMATFGRPPPPLAVDPEGLASVARALMGRLDVVDLVGKNTAVEVAERVREALLHPETYERLKAVRKWVEHKDGAFPPAPTQAELPLPPVYGEMRAGLEWWKQRNINRITWSAVEMLYTPRQMELYREDMDIPRREDTSIGKVEAAKKAKEDAVAVGSQAASH